MKKTAIPSEKPNESTPARSITEVQQPGNDVNIFACNSSDCSSMKSNQESNTNTTENPINTQWDETDSHYINNKCIDELRLTVDKLQKQLARAKLREKLLRSNLQKFRLKNKLLKQKIKTQATTVKIAKCFNPDQIHALGKKSTRGLIWSNNTVETALQLKFTCGTTGYNTLIEKKLPYPSSRTLNRRLQNLKFKPGILYEVLQFLKIKISSMNQCEVECMLAIDEMSIEPGKQYDIANDIFLGEISFENSNQLATHALVFMIGGISTHWKQTVAYCFTGNNIDGEFLNKMIMEVITALEDIGCHVNSVTTDMGPSNMKMWKINNITCGRNSYPVNSITHPCDANRRLWFFPDAVHIFKNICMSLVNNETITLPSDIQSKYELPSNIVFLEHIKYLYEEEKENELKLAPKLQAYNFAPTQFQAMRVSTATNLINNSVSSALHLLSETPGKESLKTTAWFVGILKRWFDLMTARHFVLGIGTTRMAQYEEAKQFLTECMYIFRNIYAGKKNVWKPMQKGLIIATTSALELQHYLIREKGFIYVLLGRLSNDKIENLFTTVRARQSKPTALEFKNNLKLITVSQYLKDPRNSSYDADDSICLSGFLDVIKNSNKSYESSSIDQESDFFTDIDNDNISIDEENNLMLHSLYYISGYIISSIAKSEKVCVNCIAQTGSKTPNTTFQYSKFTQFKQYTPKESLFYVTDKTFQYFYRLEKAFTFYINNSQRDHKTRQFKHELMFKMKRISGDFLNCHNIDKKILSRYVLFRLKIHGIKKNRYKNTKIYDSLSMSNSSSI